MAQLKDDCFAFDGGLMPVGDALTTLRGRVACVTETESVALRAALGRVLAEDVASPRNVPPHDNSAVDGYAVYFDDLSTEDETRLPLGGRIAAGHPLEGAALRGHAYQIFTGAPMPVGPDGTQADGPDTVFMAEDVIPEGDTVILPVGLKKGSNRRSAGEDVKQGDTILRAGQTLRAQEIGLAASVGRSALTVRKRLRVAVFSTGDEVRDPGQEGIEDGCIFDANRYTVMSLLDGLGCDVTDLGILPDDRAVIAEALAKRTAKRKSPFRFQRKLMPGGTCEATAYQVYNRIATCVCIPLGNYHNMNESRGAIDSEQISLNDFHLLIEFLVEIARQIDAGGEAMSLHSKIEQIWEARRELLE